MTSQLLNDIKKSKSIVIIGLGALANFKYEEDLENNLFKNLHTKKCVIITESDNQLFQYSLLTDIAEDYRVSFIEFKKQRETFFNKIKKINIDKINLRISYLNLSSLIIKTDKNIWIMPPLEFSIENYQKITNKDKNFLLINKYIESLQDSNKAGKYSAAEDEDVEILELFDQKKVPRGIFPRDSFYNTDHYQYVIWGLVFNREGKLLIHKRGSNARDNQNMWDKSIGGHLNLSEVKSTQDGAVRELIEELFTKENKQQSGHKFSMLTEDPSKVYFLGDWNIKNFGSTYLNQISLFEQDKKYGEENWVFYKIPTTFEHNTPRLLPDNKGKRWLRVIVDSFIFISNTSVNDETIKTMENSQFLLVEPSKLKTWVETGEKDILAKDDSDGNKDNYDFNVTPDLEYIMTGVLRDLIEEVSIAIKQSEIRK